VHKLCFMRVFARGAFFFKRQELLLCKPSYLLEKSMSPLRITYKRNERSVYTGVSTLAGISCASFREHTYTAAQCML
jgi:hypothetical protein